MKIIDAHLHSIPDRVNLQLARKGAANVSLAYLREQMKKNNIEKAITITDDLDSPTPMQSDKLEEHLKRNKNLVPVLGINPNKMSRAGIRQVEKLITAGKACGIKIYPGYYPFYPAVKKYHVLYKMAAQHDFPVIIHTGDTYGSEFSVIFSQPIHVDEVAVKFPKTEFVIAHLGMPWTVDAAEVVYKNANVHADLSGMLVGEQLNRKEDVKIATDAIKFAVNYAGDAKFVYGSDWPLVDITKYIKIIKSALPRKTHQKIFYKNAKELFKL